MSLWRRLVQSRVPLAACQCGADTHTGGKAASGTRVVTLLVVLALTASLHAVESRLSATGTLVRDAGGWLLRAEDADYRLQFAARPVREFVADLDGETVTVHGALKIQRSDDSTQLTIVADTVVQPNTRSAVAVGPAGSPPRSRKPTVARNQTVRFDAEAAAEEPLDTAYDTAVDEPEVAHRTARNRTTRGDRGAAARDERQNLDVLDLDIADDRRYDVYYDRGDRRNADVLTPDKDRRYGPDVIMLPGGGAIIRHNNW